MLGLPFLQRVKYEIHGIFKRFVILPDLHGVDHLHKRIEVAFLVGCLIVDVAD